LDRSALHQSGEIANRCNHLRFEEDDQLNGDSTAAFRMDKIAAEVEVASVFPGLICQESARSVPSTRYHLINTPTPPFFIFKTLQIISAPPRAARPLLDCKLLKTKL
jgi:hypothetical protein